MTPDEFGAKIKAKYPDYANVDNIELSRRIVAKHPEYSAQVDFGNDPMQDAVAEPKPNPLGRFGEAVLGASRFMNPLAPLMRAKDDVLGAERALLTNEPTQSMGESVLRGIPAAVGGALGGAAGLVAGAPLTFGAVGTSMAGAGLGGASLEAARQGIAQAYSGLTGRGQVQSPSYVVKETLKQGALQVPGQAINLGVGLLAKYGAARLPSALKQFVQIPEPLTQYAQKRGSAAMFTPQNLNEGAALANIGEATTDLATRRSTVGKSIGDSEDFLLGLGQGSRPVDTSLMASELRGTMTERGYLDPRTSGLARGKDVGLLNETLSTLEGGGSRQTVAPTAQTTSPLVDSLGRPIVTPGSAGVTIPDGPLTLRQAINTKRLIDSNLEFGGQMNREISDPAAAVAKNVNNQLREKVRAELGPMVSKLYDDFGVIAEAQEKLAEFTGTKALSNVEQRAVQALRGIMMKNPGEVDNIVKVLGAGLPGGEKQARIIFDSIAADPFIKGGGGSPSNLALKLLTGGGFLSGTMARGALKATESLGRAAANPSMLPRAIGPVSSAMQDAYNRQRTP